MCLGPHRALADGTVIHAEVRLGDARIWLHRVGEDLASSRTLAHLNAGLVVHVPDVDNHFARARDSGAIIDGEPEAQPYGQGKYGARALEDRHWWFAPRSRYLPHPKSSRAKPATGIGG